MLCLTGSERHSAELATRLQANRDADLQEVRLDLLEDLDQGVLPLLRGPARLVTCRPLRQGGGFRGSEHERLDLLWRALQQQPGLLDLELEVAPREWQRFLAARGETRLLCSHHAGAGESLEARAAELRRVPAQLHKLAIPVEDAADLLPLQQLQPGWPLLRIGMGAAGLLSRALPSRFGAPFTYVCAEAATATAPGQLTLAQARLYRVAEEPALQPIVLLGAEQVLRSPGPLVYNRLFAAAGLPHQYLPVITRRPAGALALLEALGCAGASVTMPLKQPLLPLLQSLSQPALRIGAVNSVRLEAGDRAGHNTDGEAVRALIGAGERRPGLLLGAGGAAAAAGVALLEAGWQLAISSRSPARASALASRLGVDAVAWEERGTFPAALLVNATPCGSDGESDPLPEGCPLRASLVLDLVVCAQATPLLRRAEAAGARVISGLQMWLEQGARQLSWLIGRRFEAAELRSHLDA